MILPIEVVPATLELLRANARDFDVAGIPPGYNIEEAIEYTLSITAKPEAALIDGKLVAAFGLHEPGTISARGMPWFMKTKHIDPYARQLARVSKAIVNSWQDQYDVLSVFVLASYATSRRWIEWMGFRVVQEITVEGHPYIYYERRR